MNRLMESDEKKVRKLKRKKKLLRKGIRNQTLYLEQLDMEIEQCEFENCTNDPTIKGDNVSMGKSNQNWRSKLVAGMLSILIPTAHALEVNEPVADVGVIQIVTQETGGLPDIA